MNRTLTATGLHRRFKKRVVVADLSLSVPPGQIRCLLGPNGAGKTTTFRMLTGLLRPHGGRVTLGDVDITRWPLWRRARAGLGYLPQGPTVFRHLSVAGNIEVGLHPRGLPSKKMRAVRDALLEEFGLAHLAQNRAEQLSGGERRRVEILRAFAAQPQVLLVDEPFASLDPLAAEGAAAQLRTLADSGVGVLITDHRVRQALELCDWVDILHAGMLLFSGTPEAAAKDEQVRALYLGEGFTDTASQRLGRSYGPGDAP